ncbi:hypothetical protein BJ165DRAFT_430932 [Panaeolus papilionaceus]|nr:hypothetical protein BJ165DRAFT_430932 [Panaeolus papilionaceus]
MLIGGTSCPFVAQKQNKVPACLVARIAYIPLPEIKSTPHSYHRWTCHDCHTSTMFPLSMAISIERIDLTAQVPIHIPLNLACKQTDRCLVPRSAKATKTHYETRQSPLPSTRATDLANFQARKAPNYLPTGPFARAFREAIEPAPVEDCTVGNASEGVTPWS